MPRLTLPALIPFLALNCTIASAGPYLSFSDPAGYAHPSQIRAWATEVVDYAPAPGADPSSDPIQGVGPADGGLVALGDLSAAEIAAGGEPGAITLTFNAPIVDGPGADFAVFENAGTFFTDPYIFAELAYVEVSSDGRVFARFPSTSLNIEPNDNGTLDPNELEVPFGRNFAGLDTTNVNNLAGIHPQGLGTPFDLADLVDVPEVQRMLVDLHNIRYVRLVDIPGDGSSKDWLGNPILDTWPTSGGGGFDLDAVGVINTVPEPATFATLLALVAAWVAARRWT